MLDTNVVSDLIRNPVGTAARRLSVHGAEGVCVSIGTAAELRLGAAKKESSSLTAAVDGVLARIAVLPLEPPCDAVYARLRLALERAGLPIGPNDLLIASHALSLGLPLITANTAEFSRVPGLAIDNWLA